MSGLLAADQVAVLLHVLGDILVPDRGLLIPDAQFIQRLVQAHVGHDGGDDLGVAEHAALLEVLCGEIEDVVAVADVPLLVHRQAAVRVSVKGEADIQLVLKHMLLKLFDVGGAAVDVDVQAVRVVGDHIGIGAEGVKNALGHHPGAAVGAVQADALALVGAGREGNQVAEIAVPAGGIVDGLADVGALGIGKLLIAVEIGLDTVQEALFHLVAVGIDELDSVVVIGVVAGGDHDAAVEIVDARDIGNAGRGGNMEHIGVRAGSRDAGDQGMLQHIAGSTGVLADDHAGLVIPTVIPADEPSDLIGMLYGQDLVDLAAKTIRSEIFSHGSLLTAAWRLRSPCRRSHPDGAAARRRAPSR